VFVMCDTNVFVRETHLLRKKGGPQLIRLLGAVKGHLFVPAILHTEYIEQTRIAAAEERSRIRTAFGAFQTLTGGQGEHALLDDDGVDQRTQARLGVLEPLIHSATLSDELLAAAGRRSIGKRRPVWKSDHGYKDCLIWESLLRLPEGSEVRFVSRDSKGFFDDSDKFAHELVEEAKSRGIAVVGLKDIDQVVRELQASNPSLDFSTLQAFDLVEKSSAESEEGRSKPLASEDFSLRTAPLRHVELRGALDEAVPVTHSHVAAALSQALDPFRDHERRVLGYVAYLGDPSKEQLFGTLSLSGIPTPIVRNVAERLALSGVIQDTGHHFLVRHKHVAQAAAALVEDEIISLLSKGS
jgi:hypothetical protein